MTAIPDVMRAVRLETWGAPPVLTEVPVPRPTGPAVLLRVDAAGLCQSDLHVMDAGPGQLPYELPFTLGHEIAGTVVALGDQVDPSWSEESVVVHGIWSCGRCRNCTRGRENYCLRLAGGPVGGGLGRDGGLADYVLVPDVRHLVRNPSVPAVGAAPLTDAGLTTVHALGEHLHLVEDGTALLIGAGGLGHLALQLLTSAPRAAVVAVDTRASARDLALRLGAAAVAGSVAEAAELLDGLGRGPGVDLVVDFVGAPATLAEVPRVLAPGGVLVLVGSAGGRIDAAKGAPLPSGWHLEAPFWGPRAALEQTIALADRGQIEAHTTTYALADTIAAYDDLRGGRVAGRAVVQP